MLYYFAPIGGELDGVIDVSYSTGQIQTSPPFRTRFLGRVFRDENDDEKRKEEKRIIKN